MIPFPRFLLITFAGMGIVVTIFSVLLPIPMFLTVFMGLNVGLILASIVAMQKLNPGFARNRGPRDRFYVMAIIIIVGINAQVVPSLIPGLSEEILFGVKGLILTTGYVGAVLTLLKEEYDRSSSAEGEKSTSDEDQVS